MLFGSCNPLFTIFPLYSSIYLFVVQSHLWRGPHWKGGCRDLSPVWATNAVELRNAHEIYSILPATYQISKAAFVASQHIVILSRQGGDCRTNNRIIRKGVLLAS